MNFLRKLVSRKRNRFIDDKFNLDLTYITPRIIAMSYPASGVESMYRNNIDHVAKFLNKRHGENYYIINVSSRLYDYSKFGNRVLQIVWPNHHPAQFILFCQIVLETVKILLTKGPQSVVVVHCLGGKGRTGSVINCVLWLSGLFDSVEQANTYYLSKRHVNVTYPSQIDYMRLFAEFMEKGIDMLDFRRKRLIRAKLRTSDWFFLDERIFKLKIYDYAKENKILYERCFGIEVTSNQRKEAKRHKSQIKKSSGKRLTKGTEGKGKDVDKYFSQKVSEPSETREVRLNSFLKKEDLEGLSALDKSDIHDSKDSAEELEKELQRQEEELKNKQSGNSSDLKSNKSKMFC